MKRINIHLVQIRIPPHIKYRTLADYEQHCANCCLRSHKDCTDLRELGVPDCTPSKEFPKGSYFIKVNFV